MSRLDLPPIQFWMTLTNRREFVPVPFDRAANTNAQRVRYLRGRSQTLEADTMSESESSTPPADAARRCRSRPQARVRWRACSWREAVATPGLVQ